MLTLIGLVGKLKFKIKNTTIINSIFLFTVLFLRFSKRLCWRNAKDHLDTTNGQALTVNPSTDLLVTAQYAPVSEVVYQPPATNEDTEQSKLMPQENKELRYVKTLLIH